MVAYPYCEALSGYGEHSKRAIMGFQKAAGVFEEYCAPCRKLHVPGRSFEKASAEPLLKPLELEADRSLRRPHRLSRPREAAKFGGPDESLDGIQVEGALHDY